MQRSFNYNVEHWYSGFLDLVILAPTPCSALGSLCLLPPVNIPTLLLSTQNIELGATLCIAIVQHLYEQIYERAVTGSARPLVALNSETGRDQRPSAVWLAGTKPCCCVQNSVTR